MSFVKSNQVRFNESKLNFYNEIETLRLKYERGPKAAKIYQKRCKEINNEFQRIFIEKNINFKRDLDSSWVREFIETKNFRVSNISFDERSLDNTYDFDSMDKKTKSLYLCIKKQICRDNHPINLINQEFSRVFSICYKNFVNKGRMSSKKLIKNLNNINKKVEMMQSEYELPSPRVYGKL